MLLWPCRTLRIVGGDGVCPGAAEDLHRQAGAQPARVGRGEVGHGLQCFAVAAAAGAKPFTRFDGLAAHHLQIEDAPIAIGEQRAVVTQLGLRHPHGPARVIDGVAPPLGLGVDLQLHLLPDVDRLPLADADVGDAVAQLDRPVFAGHHLLGQGGGTTSRRARWRKSATFWS